MTAPRYWLTYIGPIYSAHDFGKFENGWKRREAVGEPKNLMSVILSEDGVHQSSSESKDLAVVLNNQRVSRVPHPLALRLGVRVG